MTQQDAEDQVVGTYEEQMLEYARRQTKTLETGLLLLEVVLFVGLVGAVVWLIAVLGS